MSSVRSLSLLQARRTTSHSPLSGYLISRVLSQRSHIHHSRYGRRAFHWQSAAVQGAQTAIEGAQTLMVDLHSITGLPWFLTIPLVAFTVGAVFRLPFTIHTQIILRRRAQLGPILQAWNVRIGDSLQRSQTPRSQFRSEVKNRQDEVDRRIYKKLGLQEWKRYGGLLSFPFWLIAIDGVRRLCGGPLGLIGSLIAATAGVTGDSTPATTGPIADDAAMDPGVVSPAMETARTAIVEPSLMNEGCLWFTDLTASDPYHILPFALSASLIFNLLPKTSGVFYDRLRIAMGRLPQSRQTQVSDVDDKVSLRERTWAQLYLIMLGVAAMIGPATIDLPAALHLYWLASSMSNALFVKLLNHLMPIKRTVRKPCTGVEVPFLRPQRKRKV